eukprot:CAMPEP_0183732634 /NCGR_PEP_ID=MMETSP0737-20130205/38978_1 /TAXON_ID=385413 /ORGANISM="Thalassiosira miniscula, Strain CCMP1093" /LENGTH=163 /DNA_ID=CAMNT_0025965703 /DNA_START=52 /DNA_END=540 /DNA_ORIENTATION=+
MNPIPGVKTNTNEFGNNSEDESNDNIKITELQVTKKKNDNTSIAGASSSTVTVKRSPSTPIASALSVRTSSSVLNMNDPLKRRHRDQKVVGLADGLRASTNTTAVDQMTVSKKVRLDKYNGDIPLEDDENYARSKEERRPLVLVIIGYFTALKIFLYYLISLS